MVKTLWPEVITLPKHGLSSKTIAGDKTMSLEITGQSFSQSQVSCQLQNQHQRFLFKL